MQLKKGKIERCQEKLAECKKITLKQHKFMKIANREEDGWEVVKCYLSDDLASDSKHLSRARRKAAVTKRKRKQISKKIKRNSFAMPLPLPEKKIEIFGKAHH